MNQRHTKTDFGLSADEIALRWLSRRMSGSMNAEERRDFDLWLAASPENRKAFRAAENLLSNVDGIGDDLLAREFERELNEQAAQRRAQRTQLTALAATLAAVALAGVISVFAVDLNARPALAYETAIGGAEKITLADGSLIELNTASRIEVDYDRTTRLVELSGGEAYFNVAKDAARPFVVKTSLAAIVVTGTSFNVSTINDRSIIHVLTGVVDVRPKHGAPSTLLAGDAVTIDKDGSAGPVLRYDPSLVFGWRTGKARFRDAPLGEVVQSLNRYFETPIVLADQNLAALPVTGEFDIRDRETAIAALKLVFDLDSADEPARTVLKKVQQ